MWIDLWKEAGSDARRWSVLKLHTVHHPDMCLPGRQETFGCSEYLVQSAEAADRWSAERPDPHGNTVMIPWNKCPELLTTVVRECLEVYAYTDPSSGVAAADELAKRRWWSSTAVSCIRDLYDKFLELWGDDWQQATERTRRAKEMRAEEEAEGEEEMQAEEIQTEEVQAVPRRRPQEWSGAAVSAHLSLPPASTPHPTSWSAHADGQHTQGCSYRRLTCVWTAAAAAAAAAAGAIALGTTPAFRVLLHGHQPLSHDASPATVTSALSVRSGGFSPLPSSISTPSR